MKYAKRAVNRYAHYTFNLAAAKCIAAEQS